MRPPTGPRLVAPSSSIAAAQALARAAGGFAVAALLAGVIASCSSAQPDDQQCLAAFRNAEPRALPPYQVSPLDDAIKACATLAEWRAAWDAFPGAHPGRSDAVAFLADRCTEDELAATRLCRSFKAESGS